MCIRNPALYVVMAATIAASICPSLAEPRDELRDQLSEQIAEFCRDVHKSEPLILPEFIEEQSSVNAAQPDLVFRYKNIRCEGVDQPALKQCGFCGLTMNGMVCKVATFTYQNGKYVEASSTVEPFLQ